MEPFEMWSQLEYDISQRLLEAYNEAEMESHKRGLKNYDELGWVFQDAFFDIVEMYEGAKGWTLIDDDW